MTNKILVGKIVGWPTRTLDEDDEIIRFCGVGTVIAVLEHPFILVETMAHPRHDPNEKPEPRYLLTLSIGELDLQFWHNLDECKTWFDYIFSFSSDTAAEEKWSRPTRH